MLRSQTDRLGNARKRNALVRGLGPDDPARLFDGARQPRLIVLEPFANHLSEPMRRPFGKTKDSFKSQGTNDCRFAEKRMKRGWLNLKAPPFEGMARGIYTGWTIERFLGHLSDQQIAEDPRSEPQGNCRLAQPQGAPEAGRLARSHAEHAVHGLCADQSARPI